MSASRNSLNRAALAALASQPAEIPGRLLMTAAAGSGSGGLSAWSKTIVHEGTELTPGSVYRRAGGWSLVTSGHSDRSALGLCLASAADPASSTLLLGGEFARSGTAGAPLYVGSGGTLTESYPGEPDNTTTTAPWVWAVGWQITADLAIFLPPLTPYRPRRITYCLEDGETQLELIMAEVPA